MTRLLYNPALVFAAFGLDAPLLSQQTRTVGIYTDAAATTLASITDTSGNAVAGSLLTADANSIIPAFYGPTGSIAQLYAKPTGGSTVTPLTAAAGTGGGLELGYAEITSPQSTSSGTFADIAGLSTGSIYVPSTRPLRIEIWTPGVYANSANKSLAVQAMEGSTVLGGGFANGDLDSTTPQGTSFYGRVASPTVGNHTFKAQFALVTTGTLTFYASASYPAFIRVTQH